VISELLNRITRAKVSQEKLVRYAIAQDTVVGNKLRTCGSWLHLREWLEHGGETRLLNANFCKQHVLCSACAVRRAARLVRNYAEKVEQVQKEKPDLIPAMVTLTVRNGEDLAERLAHFKKSWSRMISARRRNVSGGHRHRQIEWCKVVGSVRSLEVTRAKNGLWHPHAHVFVFLSDYIDQNALAAQWERFTGDSFVVGVTKCHGGIVAGLIEVLKYATKQSTMDNEAIWETFRVLRGSRLVDPQGILRGVPEPDLDSDDIEPELTGATRDYIAAWSEHMRKFTLQDFDPEPPLPVRPSSGRRAAPKAATDTRE
jgi:hypothetical protein